MKLKEFFYFQKSDRQVLLFLLVTALIAVGLFYWVGGRDMQTTLSLQDSLALPSKGEGNMHYGRSAYHAHNAFQGYYTSDGTGEGRRAELFDFDPNKADSNQLLNLGLSPWQVRNIYRYRAKGGVFRSPEDFAQIYGVTKEQYEKIRPYIRISDQYQPASRYVTPSSHYADRTARDTVKYPTKIGPNEKIVLNTADTAMLKKVPGIGSGWARRIVSYGQQLGGYTDVAQLTEMDGFPHESLPYFIIRDPHPHKMNLNKLTLNQLRMHPYINFYQARAICDYRRLKGNLTSLSQLRLLKDFPPSDIERLRPYVEF